MFQSQSEVDQILPDREVRWMAEARREVTDRVARDRANLLGKRDSGREPPGEIQWHVDGERTRRVGLVIRGQRAVDLVDQAILSGFEIHRGQRDAAQERWNGVDDDGDIET